MPGPKIPRPSKVSDPSMMASAVHFGTPGSRSLPDSRSVLTNTQLAQARQVETAREGLALAENELAQARRRYEGGVANSIEVTDAQTRLIRARDNRIAALYNYNLARIDLGTATGTIQSMIR